MPGITGVIDGKAANLQDLVVSRMVTTMCHEPYYSSGTYSSIQLHLSCGWVCHPNMTGRPVWNESKDVGLLFVGEHYGQSAPREISHLLDKYEDQGIDFLAQLNGWFSGLILDLRRNRVMLFNDRYGLSRVYIHENEEGFSFASEAKALLRENPELRALDPRGLGEWFTCGCVLQDRSLYSGISLLPAGSVWTFENGRVNKSRYFDRKRWEALPRLDLHQYSEKTGDVLKRIVPRYFDSEGVGLSLTGGVDSRMVLSATPPDSRFPCYTFGGMYRESADVRVARQLAAIRGSQHQTLALTPSFFSEFPDLARQSVYRTDGTMDVSGAAGLFVNSLAREVAPIRMTGNYGGEILRGLVHLKYRRTTGQMYSLDIEPYLHQAESTFVEEKAVPRASFVAFKQVPWLHYARFALEQSKLTIRTPFLDNELVALSFQAPPQAYVDKSPALDFIRNHSPSIADVQTDRGIAAGLTWLPIKLRRSLTEFMPKAEYVYDYGMPHWLARTDRLVAPLHIERLFLGRQKYTHFRLWYRDELSSFIKEILLDHQTLTRPYLNRRFVEQMVVDHAIGRGNYTTEIHQLLTIEMVERTLLQSP